MKMSFILDRIIVGVLIIFQCYVASSQDVLDDAPTKIASGSEPLKTAGYMVQQVTSRIHYVGQIYYFQREDELIYINRKKNGTINVWHLDTGKEDIYQFEELSNEIIGTVSPVKTNVNQFLVGSNRNFRLYSRTSAGFKGTEPLINIDEPGYVIYSAHCDRKGVMYILLVSKNRDTSNLGKFYKIENRKAVFVKDLNTKSRDFRFNFKNTAMFIVHDYGKKIARIDYNNSRELEGATEVFDITNYPELKHHVMTSVVVDRTKEHLWVTAAGKEGYMFEIDPDEKSLVSVTSVPSKDLTFITFGDKGYQTLFVGSKSTCTEGKAQGAIYAISGMGVRGDPDTPINW